MDGLARLLEKEALEAREHRVFGLVTAIVKGINDDGTYELDYLSMGDEDPSTAARVMMPMAGKGRGTYFLPQKGDEVVVAFELGDTSLPIILGAVWNDDDPPPDQAQPSPDNNIRTIVSRSGHEVTFDDTPGAEKVTLKTNGGHKLELEDLPLGKVTLESKGGGAIEISDAIGSLTIRAPLSINFQSPSISFSSTSGGGRLSIDAPAGIKLLTTGDVRASAIIIENTPFSFHVHQLGPGTTGPVVGV